MDILLIMPRVPGNLGHKQPPLGLSYIASAVRDLANVSIADLSIQINYLKQKHNLTPKIIGVSVSTPTVRRAIEIIKVLKIKHPKALYVAGGIHASFYPDELLQNGFDIVVRGEGERTFRKLVLALKNGNSFHSINGLSYISSDKTTIHNPDQKRIETLDELPFPARDLLPKNGYEHYSVITSRGCQYNCFFCSSTAYWGNHVRYRSSANVIDELKKMHDAGQKRIYLCDDNLPANKNLLSSICHGIIKNNLNLDWAIQSRVNHIDEDITQLLVKAGCKTVSFGIESGSPHFLMNVKRIKVSQIQKAIELCKQAGLITRTTWIIGLANSYEEERQSLSLMKKILPDQISIHILIPYPNTDLWMNPHKYRLIINKENFNFEKMIMSFCPELLDIVKFEHISKEQICELVKEFTNSLKFLGYTTPDPGYKEQKTRIVESFLDKKIIPVITETSG